MYDLNPQTLTSNSQVQVQATKIIAWRNLLEAQGISETVIDDYLLEIGEGKLPYTVETLFNSTYISLQAVEAALIDLYARILVTKEQ